MSRHTVTRHVASKLISFLDPVQIQPRNNGRITIIRVAGWQIVLSFRALHALQALVDGRCLIRKRAAGVGRQGRK